jgi:hypothetical protein
MGSAGGANRTTMSTTNITVKNKAIERLDVYRVHDYLISLYAAHLTIAMLSYRIQSRIHFGGVAG